MAWLAVPFLLSGGIPMAGMAGTEMLGSDRFWSLMSRNNKVNQYCSNQPSPKVLTQKSRQINPNFEHAGTHLFVSQQYGNRIHSPQANLKTTSSNIYATPQVPHQPKTQRLLAFLASFCKRLRRERASCGVHKWQWAQASPCHVRSKFDALNRELNRVVWWKWKPQEHPRFCCCCWEPAFFRLKKLSSGDAGGLCLTSCHISKASTSWAGKKCSAWVAFSAAKTFFLYSPIENERNGHVILPTKTLVNTHFWAFKNIQKPPKT